MEPIDFNQALADMAQAHDIVFQSLWARTSPPTTNLPYILYPDLVVWGHISSVVLQLSDEVLSGIVATEQTDFNTAKLLLGQLELHRGRFGLNNLQVAATVALMQKLARQLPAPHAEPVG